MTDHYQYWRDCLNGRDVAHPMTPQAGRYRMPAPKVNFTGNVNTHRVPTSPPVAIWIVDDKMRVRVGRYDMAEGEDRYLQFCDSGWHSCQAVTEEHYQRKIATGSWDDESEAVTADNQLRAELARGRNTPGYEDDSYEDLKVRIEQLVSEARAKIAKGAALTDEATDKAADDKNRLSELANKAEAKRVKEKEPHLKAEREVDGKWKPLVTLAESVYRELAAVVIKPYADEKERLRREANQKAEFDALILGANPEEVAATQAPPVRFGTRGRGTGLRNVKRARITDQDALYQHFRTHQDVIAVLTKLANMTAKANLIVPGMEIEKDTVAV